MEKTKKLQLHKESLRVLSETENLNIEGAGHPNSLGGPLRTSEVFITCHTNETK